MQTTSYIPVTQFDIILPDRGWSSVKCVDSAMVIKLWLGLECSMSNKSDGAEIHVGI